MTKKTLSVFIDESGDFGPYEKHSPYYLVAMVLHNQGFEIKKDISNFEIHLQNLGYRHHAVHSGPLIRRESIYADDLIENRKRLFNALFNFTRKLNIKYTIAKVKKIECPDSVTMTAKLSKEFANILHANYEYCNNFEQIVIYYDNGQIELTKILTSVFSTLYTHIEFRKVKPMDYKLFQVADLICTMELLAEKAARESFSNSELSFFNNIRDFKKNYLKHLKRKEL